MLKTVSSITNAIGAVNFVGLWNASTNTPALVSGVGTKGDYYVVPGAVEVLRFGRESFFSGLASAASTVFIVQGEGM